MSSTRLPQTLREKSLQICVMHIAQSTDRVTDRVCSPVKANTVYLPPPSILLFSSELGAESRKKESLRLRLHVAAAHHPIDIHYLKCLKTVTGFLNSCVSNPVGWVWSKHSPGLILSCLSLGTINVSICPINVVLSLPFFLVAFYDFSKIYDVNLFLNISPQLLYNIKLNSGTHVFLCSFHHKTFLSSCSFLWLFVPWLWKDPWEK